MRKYVRVRKESDFGPESGRDCILDPHLYATQKQNCLVNLALVTDINLLYDVFISPFVAGFLQNNCCTNTKLDC